MWGWRLWHSCISPMYQRCHVSITAPVLWSGALLFVAVVIGCEYGDNIHRRPISPMFYYVVVCLEPFAGQCTTVFHHAQHIPRPRMCAWGIPVRSTVASRMTGTCFAPPPLFCGWTDSLPGACVVGLSHILLEGIREHRPYFLCFRSFCLNHSPVYCVVDHSFVPRIVSVARVDLGLIENPPSHFCASQYVLGS